MCLRRKPRQEAPASGKARLMPANCAVEGVPLIDTTTGRNFISDELWRDRGCLILAFRRPGCVLCRDEAVKIWRLKDTLNEMGISVVGMVHQCDMAQIGKFKKYWPGPLFWDTTKSFYRALGNGKLTRGKMVPLLNPFSQAWKNIRRAKQAGNVTEHNSVGDGWLMGGTMVIGQGLSGIFLSHLESTYGDTASVAQVLDAANQATSKGGHDAVKS